jgi:hypothetical protein
MMKSYHPANLDGTSLRPVVSGVTPETGGAAHALRVNFSKDVRRRFAGEIRRDAGFNRPEAGSTQPLA